VDNLNGALVCGRYLKVDHVRNFQPPKEYTSIREEKDFTADKIYKPSGPDGRGWGEWRVYNSDENEYMDTQKVAEKMNDFEGGAKITKINAQKNKVIADEDERWEKMLMKQCDEFLDGGEMNRLKAKLEAEKKNLRKAKKKLKKKS
jgi:hypothetical protein